jgi:hypothetical protein
MLISLTTLFATMSSIFRSRAGLELENLALRHQIGVLQRSAKKRPKLTRGDLSLDKILYGSEINSLRDILRPAFCYEFVPCSISCGFGLACSLGWFALVGTC